MQQISLLIFIIFIFSNTSCGITLEKCNRNDVNINECLLRGIRNIWPYLVEGIEEYNFPSFNPHKIPYLEINVNNEFTEIVRDMELTKYDDIDFQSARLNFDNNTFELKFLQPVLTFYGNYELKGNLLGQSIFGNGTGNVTYSEFLQTFGFNFNIVKKNNKEYFQIISPYFKFENIKLITLYYENLFNGDEGRGRSIHNMMNKNWIKVLDSAKKELKIFFINLYSDNLQKIFDNVPLQDLFY